MTGKRHTPPSINVPGQYIYSFLIGIGTVEEAHALIERMTATGSEIAMPFELAPWGDHYGQVRDRFGVLWALVVPGREQG